MLSLMALSNEWSGVRMNEQNTANFIPYEGDEPYIFASYRREDSFRVIPLLNALNKAGYRVWYDDGIQAGDDWRKSVGEHIMACSVCMPLLSINSLKSDICKDEINYAQSKARHLFPIRLEPIELPPQLFQLNPLHYLRLYDYPNVDAFVDSLSQVSMLQSCRKIVIDAVITPAKPIKWSISGEMKWRLEDDGELVISAASLKGRMQDFLQDATFPFSNAPWNNKRDNITSVMIEDGITRIGDHAFLGCYNLRSITIPDSVVHIGRSAFNGCTSLKNISIPRNVASMGNYVFSRCANLSDIQVSTSNEHYCSLDGILFNREKTELLCYPSGNGNVKYTIPNTVIRIGNSAFSRCDSLNYIELPYSISCIDNYAFDGCSILNEVTIPVSVTKIGKGAFRGCDNMRMVTIPASITIIDDYVFYFCKRLSKAILPEGIISIGDLAFCGCHDLRSIQLPQNVQYIEDGPWASFSPWTTIIRL